MGRPSRDPGLRFWEKVAPPDARGCMLWVANRDKDGYGLFYFSGSNKRAHRVAWTLINGPIPAGLFVLHKCDNPPCQQIDHLWLGTAQDNMTDKLEKDRQRYPGPIVPFVVAGELNGNHKLMEKDVLEIIELYSTGRYTQKVLGRRFGVLRTQISRIVNHKRWKHLGEAIHE